MKVTLIKPLTLAGDEHAVGDRVEVDAATAAWLAEHKIIEPLATTTTGKAAGSKE